MNKPNVVQISFKPKVKQNVYEIFNISPAVVDLMHVLDVSFLTYRDLDRSGFQVGQMYSVSRGLYTPCLDQIALNEFIIAGSVENRREIVDLVVLHEISHWTGHSTRLNRKTIVELEDAKPVPATYDNLMARHGEELAAQTGMLKLAVALGVATYFHYAAFREYKIGTEFLPNQSKYLQEGEDAAQFVLSILNQNQKKAA